MDDPTKAFLYVKSDPELTKKMAKEIAEYLDAYGTTCPPEYIPMVKACMCDALHANLIQVIAGCLPLEKKKELATTVRKMVNKETEKFIRGPKPTPDPSLN